MDVEGETIKTAYHDGYADGMKAGRFDAFGEAAEIVREEYQKGDISINMYHILSDKINALRFEKK